MASDHYIIDGYNLLFKLREGKRSLQLRRSELLGELNRKVLELKLSITIVFDAGNVDPEESVRTHYDQLEIIYTAKDETADEYILQYLYNMSPCKGEILVTSDGELGRRAHLCGAQVQTIAQFLSKLLKEKKRTTGDKKSYKESPKEIERLMRIFQERLDQKS